MVTQSNFPKHFISLYFFSTLRYFWFVMQVHSKLHKINCKLAESQEIKVHLLGCLKTLLPMICLLLFLPLFHFCIWAAHIDPLLLAPASVLQQRFLVWIAPVGTSVSASYGSNFFLCFLLIYPFLSLPPGPPTSVGKCFFVKDKKKKHCLKIYMSYEF
jgi:hypothetical protein